MMQHFLSERRRVWLWGRLAFAVPGVVMLVNLGVKPNHLKVSGRLGPEQGLNAVPRRSTPGSGLGNRAEDGIASRTTVPSWSLNRPQVLGSYVELPLSFEINQGQTDEQVKFLSRGKGYALFLTSDEAVLALSKSVAPTFGSAHARVARQQLFSAAAFSGLLPLRGTIGTSDNEVEMPPHRSAYLPVPYSSPRLTDRTESSTVLRMHLVGANANATVTGADVLPGRSNYFIGNDPKKWRTNVPNYARVKYKGVYPGVDLVYYGRQGQLEYDFVVAAGADPDVIALDVAAGLSRDPSSTNGGVKPPLQIAPDGDLVAKTGDGEVRFHKPMVYQPASSNGRQTTDDRQRTPIEGHYILEASNQIGFRVPSYDHARPLVIDPVLTYSTYLGGSAGDGALAIALDASGNAYVTGMTSSTDFPTVNPFQANLGGSGNLNAFVAKLNATGSALVYSTYLGGNSPLGDVGSGVAVDSTGNAYVTGHTYSSNFPTVNPFQANLKGFPNAFVAKLNSAGSVLVYSSYLGGSSFDLAQGIATDTSGNAYVTGFTSSLDFPTVNPLQATFHGLYDCFVAKLNSAGSALTYSTYLGGSNDDEATGIAADASGNAYVTGRTSSTDFPTVNPFQATNKSGLSAFVAKLNAAGSGLIYSTYLGGSNAGAAADAIAVDASGDAYLTGSTMDLDFPTTQGAIQGTCPGGCNFFSGFVSELSPAGSALVYSTYLGGTNGRNDGLSIAVDSSGNAYVTGLTQSTDFPTVNPLQATNLTSFPNLTGFVAKLNAGATALVYSTYLGGSVSDQANGIAVDSSGNAYVTGFTSSTDFPTASPFQATNHGISNAFIAKISPGNGLPVATITPGPLIFAGTEVGSTSLPEVATLTNTGTGALSINSIGIGGTNSGDFAQTSTCGATLAAGANCPINVTFTPSAAGTRTATLIISDNAAGSPQTVSLTGMGLQGAASLSPTSLSFGNEVLKMTSGIRSVTVTNTGTAPLTVSSVATSAEFASNTTCTGPVSPGGTCTLNISFTPTLLGTQTGTVTVTSDASNSPQVVNLTGNGFSGAALSCTSCGIGYVVAGTGSAVKAITLANAQNVALNNISVSISGSHDYSQTNTCGTALGALQMCTITVTFAPSKVGIDNSTLTVTDSATNSPQTATLLGKGLASSAQLQTLPPTPTK